MKILSFLAIAVIMLTGCADSSYETNTKETTHSYVVSNVAGVDDNNTQKWSVKMRVNEIPGGDPKNLVDYQVIATIEVPTHKFSEKDDVYIRSITEETASYFVSDTVKETFDKKVIDDDVNLVLKAADKEVAAYIKKTKDEIKAAEPESSKHLKTWDKK
jgi:archaellin